MITEIVTFWGTVQGVGFRPTLSRLAAKYRMKGQVRNMGAFVQLIVTDEPSRIGEFIGAVQAGKPRMADIMRIDREIIDTVLFDDFRIVSSAPAADEIAAIPADIAVCEDCLAEFRDPKDQRYLHPFISCTNCGPRYTIMERLPYDRDTTTMDSFPMCGFCEGEYKDSGTRRYHAQTISCHDCGPQPIWVARNTSEPSSGEAVQRGTDDIAKAIAALKAGGVIALKGVGGYYFVCSPFHEATVQRLRDIKVREYKPFAVMFASVEEAREYCEINAEEEALLTSPKRPIALLEKRNAADVMVNPILVIANPDPQSMRRFAENPRRFADGVLSSSRFVGAFLPSMALQHMLLDALGPLIMTSANIAELPIIRDDEEMLAAAERDERISGVLCNTRRIVRRLDDSVARVVDGAPQLIRRSKGWTPVPIYVRGTDRLTKDAQIFATGGHLKSAFALTKGSFVYMSQYIGDIDNVETERVYRENLSSMQKFFSISPKLVAHDMHPLYWTTGFASECGITMLPVQHHHAHIASVMAEHGLAGPVIGVAFDGTGYGTDGTIWGGEILICEGAGFERYSHLHRIEMIGGDQSMRDAWKSAVSWMESDEGRSAEAENQMPPRVAKGGERSNAHAEKPAPRAFDIDISDILAYAREHGTLAEFGAEYEAVRAAIAQGVNTVTTSSMGRLFDAVSSLLGIHHVNRYEGEAAIMLENAAWRAQASGSGRSAKEEVHADFLALRFHHAVADAVLAECRVARSERGTAAVCLSGGVFQNKIIMERTLKLLREDGFATYYNLAVPPNDGGIALGQAYVAMRGL